LQNDESQDLDPICEPVKPLSLRVKFLVTVVAVGIVGLFVLLFFVVPRDTAWQESNAQTDCERSAPPECVRGSVETSYDRGFRGFYYCACATADGDAVGFLATNSRVYWVDDSEPRASRRRPHPAITFPVGEPHR